MPGRRGWLCQVAKCRLLNTLLVLLRILEPIPLGYFIFYLDSG